MITYGVEPEKLLPDSIILNKSFPDSFSIKYFGNMEILKNGRYTFRVKSHDGFRLFIDQKLVLDCWREGYSDARVKMKFKKKEVHLLQLEYFNSSGDPILILQ